MTAAPTTLRQLDSAAARDLADALAALDDLQTTLECCERLITELARPEVDDVVVEALWTTALLSYARASRDPGPLAGPDIQAAAGEERAVQWHRLLLRLREHHAHPTRNPRERFSVGVAPGPDGTAAGIGASSARQPTVDEPTVRQLGALAYALSARLDERSTEQQQIVFDEVRAAGPEAIATLPAVEVEVPTRS